MNSLIYGQFSHTGLQVWEAFHPLAGCPCVHEPQCGSEVFFFRSSLCALSHENFSAEITLFIVRPKVHLVDMCFPSNAVTGGPGFLLLPWGCAVIIGVAIKLKTLRPKKYWKNIALSRRFALDLFCEKNTEPWGGRARGHKGLARQRLRAKGVCARHSVA